MKCYCFVLVELSLWDWFIWQLKYTKTEEKKGFVSFRLVALKIHPVTWMCEQGFYDTEMNRRLMFKNKGSVKRVVKELVQMYKDPSISGKEQV